MNLDPRGLAMYSVQITGLLKLFILLMLSIVQASLQ